MEVRLDDIHIPDFCLTECVNQDIVDKIRDVYRIEGQHEPLIVQSADDGYTLLTGKHRYKAARKLGWTEIEVTVKHLVNLNCSSNYKKLQKKIQKEECAELCRVLSEVFGISKSEIGDVVGLSEKSVWDKVCLLTELDESNRNKFKEGELSARKGLVIRKLPKEEQSEFTNQMIRKNWSRDELRANLKEFQNNTLVTIGAAGLSITSLISELRNKNIDILVDVRSPEYTYFLPNQMKTQFHKINGIQYVHRPEFGVPQKIDTLYEQKKIDHDEFGDRYRRFLCEKENELREFRKSVTGKVALMGKRKFAIPQKEQELFCHRYHLATELIEREFANRMYDARSDDKASLPPLEVSG